MKKKVFCVLRSLGAGGAQKALTFVANLLAATDDYEVHLITLYQSTSSLTLEPSIKVIYGPYSKDEFTNSSFWGRKKKQIQNLIWIHKIIKNSKPDLMIVFLADLVFLCKMAMFGLRIPFIASERGTPQNFSFLQKIRYCWGYLLADVVVFQTKRQQQYFSSAIQKKSYIIENAITIRNDDARNVNNQVTRNPYFMAGGALSSIKGFDIAILASELVTAKFPDFQLHIYGDGPERQHLQQMIFEHHLERNVILKGEKDNIFEHANRYSGFLLSSRSEGIPNVLLEAILTGLPVVATDCLSGGPRTILNDGRRGVLIPTEDPEKMAQGIISILSDPEQSQKIALSCREECKQQFGPTRIAQKWINLVKKILE
ncbi:glycosyltransferase [Victivallis sp. Marseille-Q1083]|uniref:glycosyltransferase n=1 Tax=Victivallis sp. Marseille-Q1083 TaxID=2717288 RepID=UPI00158B87DC|nr:glycosyltransferase [Victivallis sp. Marseille-Q1083]